MSQQLRFIDTQWRWMRRFFIVWPFWCALIIGINIWSDAQAGRPFDWGNLLFGSGIALFGGVVFFFSRAIFKFVRGFVSNREDMR
ncbi:MAG: hypothetical protein P0Y64_05270 [Candidatus Sphingomonas colombiensis]|nr:hypothetical protein [Sphingomonas sp.]WEK44225.1 MAG: hypothetical protein P0Y64_05270 [Sphingomonas sp.]